MRENVKRNNCAFVIDRVEGSQVIIEYNGCEYLELEASDILSEFAEGDILQLCIDREKESKAEIIIKQILEDCVVIQIHNKDFKIDLSSFNDAKIGVEDRCCFKVQEKETKNRKEMMRAKLDNLFHPKDNAP